ncbi:MAG: methyltransferase domain-containing protein [Pseudomonadota bacterium]
MNLNKVSYFARSAVDGVMLTRRCPNCGAAGGETIDRKFHVTQLIRCDHCALQYRFPPDRDGFDAAFYSSAYSQGMTTDLPDDTTLNAWKKAGFAGTDKDFSRYLTLLANAGVAPGARVLDFGCSWGYGAWQLAQAGYDVTGAEIGEGRRAFARDKLGVTLADDLTAYATAPEHEKFDCVFSAHVLEHIAEPAETLTLLTRITKRGGRLVLITPNGSEQYRRTNPSHWHSLWGLKHPNMIDEQFYGHRFSHDPKLIVSQIPSAETVAKVFGAAGTHTDALDGPEIILILRNDAPA